MSAMSDIDMNIDMNIDIDPTVPAPTVWACLSYRHAKEAIRFLVDAFGFEERLVVPGEDHDDPAREVAHAELVWPQGGGVMLGSAVDTGDEFASRPTGAGSTYCVCDDPDGLLARARAAGAELVRDIRDEDYGSRGFTVRDPEGNLWSFGTYRGATKAKG
jgi:uncharacterized glyoxalase superfamily protein PhnB